MRRVILLAMVLTALHYSPAAQQQKAGKKLQFGSQNYAGILEGEAGTSFQAQTINGVKYKTWFTGIGLGLDYYYDRSIPLFLSVSKFLPSVKIPLYFNADAGVSIPWSRNDIYYFESAPTDATSFFWAGGLGYRFRSRQNDHGFLLNLGYSYKHLIQENEYVNPCLVPPCPVEKERYDYRLKRLSVKVGWMF
ncbi:MAG TPA: hypothetical protein VGO58_01865 [Chitinophagaceae bacterium]|jgi:hypothetical protein|nr:hypothetical protein [Chitinophagaceae bacterium]